nr:MULTISPECIES: endonuclease MutS2 [unclassified Helicobacter]
MQKIISQLDLDAFLTTFQGFFSRKKDLVIDGDKNIIFEYIKELDLIDFRPPDSIKPLDDALQNIKKFGILRSDEIFEIIKIIRYFSYLKNHHNLANCPYFYTYLQKIVIPEYLINIEAYFDDKGAFKQGIFLELDHLNQSLIYQNKNIQQTLNTILHSKKIQPYLIDQQIHLINQTQTLLLRSGYQSVIKGIVLQRSHSGFFYLLPEEVKIIYQKIQDIENQIEQVVYEICKTISQTLHKHFAFLNFINKEFDKVDHIQARIFFAKQFNLNFILPQYKNHHLVLKDFAHPILQNPKLINLDFSKQLLLITGVNAGGKTMLLKSILSAVFLSKHLIPFKIDAQKSKIPHFKNIFAIISDPQNSKNDISTFAGRMLDFSQILQEKDLILGIDEIELGTDADEAASLYKVLLENLLDKKAKIIVTTHHKRLASIMANDSRIQLCAAIYDEEKEQPTFNFLYGCIGKSYAFETAKRYKIPSNLIELAKQNYGEDKEKLNILIEKSAQLEIELKQKIMDLDSQIQDYKNKQQSLKDLREKLALDFKQQEQNLKKTYYDAIEVVKKDLKDKQMQDIHRSINNANKILASLKPQTIQAPKQRVFQVHDRVKYKQNKATILAIQNNKYLIELDEGMRLKVDSTHLKPIGKEKNLLIKPKTIQPSNAFFHLDLHGLRAQEAIEKLDKFISDSLISGFDEVLIYHGIGGGILAKVVREFLSSHPKVVSFEDAPPNLGGFGAKVVKL